MGWGLTLVIPVLADILLLRLNKRVVLAFLHDLLLRVSDALSFIFLTLGWFQKHVRSDIMFYRCLV